MDVETEINNHQQWLSMLKYLVLEDEEILLSISDIHSPNHCSLGQWLNSADANSYRDHKHFMDLVKLHSEFHNLAGEILAKSRNNHKKEASEKLNRLDVVSKKLINLLSQFK